MFRLPGFLIFFAAAYCPALAVETAAPVEDHGDEQVSFVVHDRPQLQGIVVRGTPIWNWLRDAFDFSEDGAKIFWDPGPVTEENAIGRTQFLKGQICFIRVDATHRTGPDAGTVRTGEDILGTLVFELHNARYTSEMRQVDLLALAGKFTREEFCQNVAKLEFGSDQGCREFYSDLWLPYCHKNELLPDSTIWERCQASTFESWLKLYPPEVGYPVKTYGGQYDWLIQKYGHH